MATLTRPWARLASAAPERARRAVADAETAGIAVEAVALVAVPQALRPGDADAVADQRPVLAAQLLPELGAEPSHGDRARVPADGGGLAQLLQHAGLHLRELLAARLVSGAAAVIELPRHRLDERRQGRLAVAGDREIDLGEALELLVIGLGEEVVRAEADGLGAGARHRRGAADDAVAEGVQRAPVVVELEAEDDIGLRHRRGRAAGVVERMARREVGASALVDHRALQQHRELDQPVHARLAARHAVGDDQRALGLDQQLRRLGHRAAVAHRQAGARQLRDAQLLAVADRDSPAARHRATAAPAPSAASSPACRRALPISAKCCSEPGWSSHLTKSRTMAAGSCAECAHSTSGPRLSAVTMLPMRR